MNRQAGSLRAERCLIARPNPNFSPPSDPVRPHDTMKFVGSPQSLTSLILFHFFFMASETVLRAQMRRLVCCDADRSRLSLAQHWKSGPRLPSHRRSSPLR